MAIIAADEPIKNAEIIHVESMVASAWPASKHSICGSWMLGCANGLTGRANCLFFLNPVDNHNIEERLDRMENSYRRLGLSPRVRVSPLTPLGVVAALEKRGYAFHGQTLVLRRDRPSVKAALPPDFEIDLRANNQETWLDLLMQFSPRFQGKRAILLDMLGRIVDETRYLTLRKAGTPLTVAMIVRQLGIVTIQNLVTLKTARRQGCAHAAMQAIFTSDFCAEAKWCWLAVEAHNMPALLLYKNWGFREFYRYIYASTE